VILAVLVLVAVGAGLWSFEQRAHDYLRRALGRHVQDLAVAVAATAPADSLAFWALRASEPGFVPSIQPALVRIRQDNGLANVFLCLPGTEVVADASGALQRGAPHPFLVLDLAEVEAARAGIATHSRLYHSLGEHYWMSGYAPVFDGLGEVVGFAGVEASVGFFDALDRLRRSLAGIGMAVVTLVGLLLALWVGYARRLATARAALLRQEGLSAMGRMAAGVAHEIRNPLGIIKNTAQLVRDDLREQQVEAPLLDFIPEEVDRLDEILTGYLDFARQAPPRFAEVRLERLLRRTLDLLEQDCAEAGVRVEQALDDHAPVSLVADPRRLQQVFLNLFLNALQAMPEGGRLGVEVEDQADTVTVRIRDTGVGLDPKEAAGLFEPFVTSKEKGSGLGLSVVRRIVVEDHGGTVRLDGRPGAGAVVTVVLPRRPG
jgi:signal transduction histidine kinase